MRLWAALAAGFPCGDSVEMAFHNKGMAVLAETPPAMPVPLGGALRRLLVVAVLATASSAFAGVPRVPARQARALQLNHGFAAVVDVRPPDLYAAGHIQGARSMPEAEVTGADWAKGGKTLVYCTEDPCATTEKALERLAGMGYGNLVVLEGGFAAWQAAGFPVEKGAPKVSRASPGRLSAKAAKAGLAKWTVVDARAAGEFALGHLPGARSVPLEKLDELLGSVPKGAPVLVYDMDAARSRRAAEKLIEAGHAVSELVGGLGAWVRKGYGLELK
jgi:rhodanese-related sulfurtransferase